MVGCLKQGQDLIGSELSVGACSWRKPREDVEREEHEENPEDFADSRSISLKLSMWSLYFEEEKMEKKKGGGVCVLVG